MKKLLLFIILFYAWLLTIGQNMPVYPKTVIANNTKPYFQGSVKVKDTLGSSLFYLQNGLMGSGKFAKCVDANGKMDWYNIAFYDITGLSDSILWAKGQSGTGNLRTKNSANVVIGNYSIVAGYNNNVTGVYSFTTGDANISSNGSSLTYGSTYINRGSYSTVGGKYSQIPSGSWGYSIAIGDSCIADNSHAIAFGYHTYAQGAYSMAIGNNTQTINTGNNQF